MVDRDQVVTAVRGWINKHAAGRRDLPEDYALLDSGLLTSLMTLELIAFLQDRFGAEIADDDVTEENFGSVSAIADLVGARSRSG